MEKHELSKIDFEMIDDTFKPCCNPVLDPMTADKIADLRNIFEQWLGVLSLAIV